MTTTLTITGPTFTNRVIPGLPTISNLKTIVFFGNGVDDNLSNNRVVGGPVIAIQSGAPAYASNYVSVGLQAAGTRNDTLNTQNPRDAPTLAGGVTWCMVSRISQLTGTLQANCFCDTNATSTAQSWLAYQAANNKITLASGGAIRGSITNLISNVTNWHFLAQTYSGGPTGTMTLYDFTENATTGVPFVWPSSVTFTVGAQSPHYGAIAAESGGVNPIEVAFGLVANSVLNATTLAQVYAWAKANLARRNIVC